MPGQPSAFPPPPPAGPGAFPPGYGGPTGVKPNNYLVPAILATLFCCLPLGIVAIVKASKVDGLFQSGQYAEAEQAAADAKKWTVWSVGIGVAFLVLYGALVVGAGLLSNA